MNSHAGKGILSSSGWDRAAFEMLEVRKYSKAHREAQEEISWGKTA